MSRVKKALKYARRPLITAGSIAVAAVAAVALLAGATAAKDQAVKANAEQAVASAIPPLLAHVAPAELRDAYDLAVEFVGRVQAAQTADVAFDLPGVIVGVLIDDGDLVKAGTVLAELDTDRLEARLEEAKARVAQAEADVTLAQQTLRRVSEAVQQEAVAEADLDDAQRQQASSDAALNLAKASLRSLEVDLEKSQIVAPFDAVVSRRYVDPGAVVSPGTPVLRLLDRTAPEARIGIAGPAADAVKEGDEVTVEVRGRIVNATISRLLPSLNDSSRTIEAIVVLDAELNGIRERDLAKLSVDRQIEAKHVAIPVDALVEGSRGLFACFVAVPLDEVGEGETAATHRIERRDVQLLDRRGEVAFVSGPITDGELIATAGVHKLVRDLEVRVSAND